MYTIIILPILFAIIRIYYLNKDSYFDFYDITMLSLLNAITSFLISCFVALIIPTKTEIVKSTFELESLQDGNSINGRFFLGSGYINESMKYSFYLKEKEGYKLYSIDAKDVYIKYTDNNPKLEMFSEIETDAFINNFSLKAELKTNYIIYIPKGSIINNYTLDTK